MLSSFSRFNQVYNPWKKGRRDLFLGLTKSSPVLQTNYNYKVENLNNFTSLKFYAPLTLPFTSSSSSSSILSRFLPSTRSQIKSNKFQMANFNGFWWNLSNRFSSLFDLRPFFDDISFKTFFALPLSLFLLFLCPLLI